MAKPGPRPEHAPRPGPAQPSWPGPHAAGSLSGPRRYYRKIATRLLAHARGRPVEAVYGDGTTNSCRLDGPEQLLALCEKGALAFHGWPSREPALHCPDQLVFALNGAGQEFETLKTAAATLADLLDELELSAYPMLDGLGGLQVRVALDAHAEYLSARALARRLARAMELHAPERYSARQQGAGPRLFIDYRLNDYGCAPILPYSLSALAPLSVAAPLDWDMLADPDLDAAGLSRNRVMHWPAQRDPWAGFADSAGSVALAHARLDRSATAV